MTPKTPHSGKKSGKENSSTPKPAATPKTTPKSAKKGEQSKPATPACTTKATPSSSKPGSTKKESSAVKRVPTPIKVRDNTCWTNFSKLQYLGFHNKSCVLLYASPPPHMLIHIWFNTLCVAYSLSTDSKSHPTCTQVPPLLHGKSTHSNPLP